MTDISSGAVEQWLDATYCTANSKGDHETQAVIKYFRAQAERIKTLESAAMDRLVAEGQRLTPQEAAKVNPYKTRIGEAGDEYIRSVAFNNKHTLPAMFRWADLWDVMNKAAQENSQ